MASLFAQLLDHRGAGGSSAAAVAAYLDAFTALIPAAQYFGGAAAGEGEGGGARAPQPQGVPLKYAKHTRTNPLPAQARKEGSKRGLKRARFESDAATAAGAPDFEVKKKRGGKRK